MLFSILRRLIVMLSVAMLAAGCSHTPLLQSFSNSYHASRQKTPDAKIFRADVDKLPYASVGIKIGDGGRAMVVLARKEGEELIWVSADHIHFVTRAGRLVRTRGLPRDLAATNAKTDDPVMLGLHRLGGPVTYTSYIDLAPGSYTDVTRVSTFAVEGSETITILERSYNTLRVVENVSVSRWQWEAKNVYWVDAQTGFVWKSIQQYSPDIPPVQIEIFKPAA